MSQESYDVNRPAKGSRFRRDGSYRSFICILFVFFLLCLVIIFFGNWNSMFPKKQDKPNYKGNHTHSSLKENQKSEKHSDKEKHHTTSPIPTTAFDEWILHRENKSKESVPATTSTTTESYVTKVVTTIATSTVKDTSTASTTTTTDRVTAGTTTTTTTHPSTTHTTTTTDPSTIHTITTTDPSTTHTTTTTDPSATHTTTTTDPSTTHTTTTTDPSTTHTTTTTDPSITHTTTTTDPSTKHTTTTADPSTSSTITSTAPTSSMQNTTISSGPTTNILNITVPSSSSSDVEVSSTISTTDNRTPVTISSIFPPIISTYSPTYYETTTSLNYDESSSSNQITQNVWGSGSSSTESSLIETNSSNSQTEINDISAEKNNSASTEFRPSESTTSSTLASTNSVFEESVASNSSLKTVANEFRTTIQESESTSESFSEETTINESPLNSSSSTEMSTTKYNLKEPKDIPITQSTSGSIEEGNESTSESFTESTEQSSVAIGISSASRSSTEISTTAKMLPEFENSSTSSSYSENYSILNGLKSFVDDTNSTDLTSANESVVTTVEPDYEEEVNGETDPDEYRPTADRHYKTTVNLVESSSVPTSTLSQAFSQIDSATRRERDYEDKVVTHVSPYENRRRTTQFIESSGVCNTHQCKLAASEMYIKMDHNQAPCEDFYKYSCGGHLKVSDDSNTIWDNILYDIAEVTAKTPKFIKLYKHFYEGCLDFQYNIDYSVKLQEVIKVWKAKKIYEFKELDKMDIENLFALLLSLKSMHFMDIGKGVEAETGNIVLQLKLPEEDSITSSVFSPDHNHCLSKQWENIYGHKEDKYDLIFKKYSDCLNKNIHFENTYKEAIKGVVKNIRIAQDIYKLLENYPSLTKIDEELMKKNYSTYSIAQLDAKFPGIDWEKLFKLLLGDELGTNFKVQVYFQDYFEEWFKKFKLKEKQRFLAHIAMTDMYYNYVITRKPSNVESHCQKLTAETFKDITSYIYSKNKKNSFDLKYVESIFDGFKNDLKKTFSSETYVHKMGSACLKKIDEIKLVFNSVGEMASAEELDEKYANMKFFENETFIEMLVTVREFQMQHLLKSKYIFGNLINAYDKELAVFHETNTIYVPFGFLSTIPQDLPSYLKMSKVGIHVAKALATFFDLNRMPQLLPESNLIYYTNIFGNIDSTSLNPIWTINADLLINEAIGDNAACRLVTDYVSSGNNLPLMDHYPGNKKEFYIVLAQEFCEKLSVMDEARRIVDANRLLPSYRVNHMMMNSASFAKTFDCIPGSALTSGLNVQFPHIPDEF